MEDAATFSITKGEECLLSAREFRPKKGRGDQGVARTLIYSALLHASPASVDRR